MGHAAGTGTVCLAHKGQSNALFLRELPPQGGVHEDGVSLAVARIEHQDRQFLALKALRDIQDILPGVPFPVAAVVAERDHACLNGAVTGDLYILLAPDLGAVGQSGFHLAVLGILLGSYPGGGVVQTLGNGVGIGEGVVIAGIVGQPLIDRLRVCTGVSRDLHLGDAVLRAFLLQLAVGVFGGIGLGSNILPVHTGTGPRGRAVVGGLPIGLAPCVTRQIGGNGHVLGGDLSADAHLIQSLIQHIGNIAVGALSVIRSAGHGGESIRTGTGPVHIGLADDKDGVGGRPQLQRRGALAVACQVELTEGGEHVLLMDVVAALQEGDSGLHIGALLLGIVPAPRAGLQHEQALALLVGQVDPALFLQEVIGIDTLRHSHHSEVGADGGLRGDVHLYGAGVIGKVIVAIHVDVLGVPAGQG